MCHSAAHVSGREVIGSVICAGANHYCVTVLVWVRERAVICFSGGTGWSRGGLADRFTWEGGFLLLFCEITERSLAVPEPAIDNVFCRRESQVLN